MFNLEQSIANWRKQMLAAGIKAPVPLDELECHLREDVEEQIASGLSPRQAFEIAAQQVGCSGALKAEFKKVESTREVFQRKSVWMLIAIAFVGCWFRFDQSPAMGLAYGALLAGLIVATFFDFSYFIIPDYITLGCVFAGLVYSLLLPQLHGQKLLIYGLLQSLLGMSVGAGLLYGAVRLGKLVFAYRDVPVCLTRNSLRVGNNEFRPEEVTRMEAIGSEIILPREVMGMGDVKLMAAIGAFLGWQAVIFTLTASSIIGLLIACGLVAAHRQQWSDRIPYGPYLALAAAIWIFAGKQLLAWFIQ